MNIVASNNQLCQHCSDNFSLEQIDIIERTTNVGNQYAVVDESFDPWKYIAGYVFTKPHFWDIVTDSLNEDVAILAWIYIGFKNGLERNRLQIPTTLSAKLMLQSSVVINTTHLLKVASSNELCQFCNLYRPQKCTEAELITWTASVGHHIEGIKTHEFNPTVYIAGYPSTLPKLCSAHDDVDVHKTCIEFIYNQTLPNRFNLSVIEAESNLKIMNIVSNKRIIVCGNSVKFPSQFAKFSPSYNDVFVRFNKAVFHQHVYPTDIAVFNDSLLKKKRKKIEVKVHCHIVCMQYHQDAINLTTHMSEPYCMTSGLLFLSWLAHQTDQVYSSVVICGFDMVEPGEKAHYFDHETPAKPGSNFAGHNASFERTYIQSLIDNPLLKFVKL
jgi:hypothetical protein